MQTNHVDINQHDQQKSGLAQSQLKECNKPIFHYLMTHIQTV